MNYKDIYIIENLCRANEEIFLECLDLKHSKQINYVWTRNGVVHFTKTDDPEEKPTVINHIDDLVSHFEQYYEDAFD